MNQKLFLLLEFLRHNLSQGKKDPSFSEMVNHMNVGSKQTIEDWLTILEREGYISRVGTPRRILITQKGESPKEITKLETPATQAKSPTHLSTENYSSVFLNTSVSGGAINLKVNNINLFTTKGGEKDGTK